MRTAYDYVIVGAGSAGCVLADRLSTDGRSTVLVIEAGGSDRSPFVQIPAGLIQMPAKNYWLYETQPDPSRNHRKDMWSSGRLVGGGSSVNAMLWVRGNRADFDTWADMGAEGWDYESLLPLMRELETWEGGADRYRGDSGPQHVSRVRSPHPMTGHFIRGAEAVGYSALVDYNGADQYGVGGAQVSQRNGFRDGTGRSYLARASRRSNVTVLLHSTVRRVLINEDRVTAVEVERRGRTMRVGVDREVLLAAGAVGSPAVLQRSGVGDADQLRGLGVVPVVDLPAVGRGLQEHPTFSLTFHVTERTLNQELTPGGVARGALQFLVRRRGVATSPLTQAVAFGRIRADAPWPEYQVMFSPMATKSKRPKVQDGHEVTVKDKQRVSLPREPMVSCHVSLLHPRSSGSVNIVSPRSDVLPSISLEYFGDERDFTDAATAGRRAREILLGEAMEPYVLGESADTGHVQSDAEWRAFLAANTFNAAHWVGTARMGAATDDDVVVDNRLRLKGVSNLRVADASVMPTLPSGNTNAPTILIAEKASCLIQEDWR